MQEFTLAKRLPPYFFKVMDDYKISLEQDGNDIIDFGLANPDQSPPIHVVDRMISAVQLSGSQRYTQSAGIEPLREAITRWYGYRYQVDLNPELETIVTAGSKDALSHLALATVTSQDTVLVPTPTDPLHTSSFVIAGADVRSVPITGKTDFFDALNKTLETCWPRPKMMLLNFPSNPTTQSVDLAFFSKVVEFAKRHKIWVVHDLTYADIVFDGYHAPSILQVPGAKDVAVEIFSLSKSYNMPGWRVGFMAGNRKLIAALAHLKSYLDHGIFRPIQEAAVLALDGNQDSVFEICDIYRSRRDILCTGLAAADWEVSVPKATMFVWAKIPKPWQHLGSLTFAKLLMDEAQVAVIPGAIFGKEGDEYVRFALVQNEERINLACEKIAVFMTSEIPLMAVGA